MSPDTRLAHVYWVGGSPCAGKSTIVDRLAHKHGLTVYRCDDAWYRHSQAAGADDHPVLHRLAHATPDEIWLRPVHRQITEEIAQYREEFPMILADILDLPDDRPVIAEGAALMPDLLSALGLSAHRKLWLVPTAAFQRHHYAQREWRHSILRQCSNPEAAWDNWMDRDAGFARAIAKQAAFLNERIITVDGSRPLPDVTLDVETWFGFQERSEPNGGLPA